MLCQRAFTSVLHREQKGAISVLIVVFLLVLIAVPAFLIVEPQSLIIHRAKLQSVSEAAALSAARLINEGDFDGSPNAVIAALKQHPIPYIDSVSDDFTLAYDTHQQALVGTDDNLTIKFQRGMVSWGVNGYAFESTEDSEFVGGVPREALVNAVRVEAELTSLPAYFGAALGLNENGPIRVSSVVTTKKKVKACILPIAIPAVQFALNTDIYSTDETHLLKKLDPVHQQQRKISISLPGVRNEGVYGQQIADGSWRAHIRDRNPYEVFDGRENTCIKKAEDENSDSSEGLDSGETYLIENCKADVIEGVFALPDFQPGAASGAEILSALGQNCIPAAIGMNMRILQAADPSLFNPTTNTMLQNRLNQPENPALSQIFFKDGKPRANYPFLRADLSANARNGTAQEILSTYPSVDDSDAELRFKYPTDKGDNTMLLRGEKPGSVWNPMCHHGGNYGDLDKAKAIIGYAALIVSDVGGVKYADFSNKFKNKDQNAVAPFAQTNAKIVDFVQVAIYNGNFANLSAVFPPASSAQRATPRFSSLGQPDLVADNPASGSERDDVPVLAQYIAALKNYFANTLRSYFKDCVVNSTGNPPPSHCPDEIPPAPPFPKVSGNECFEYDPPDAIELAELLNAIRSWWKEDGSLVTSCYCDYDAWWSTYDPAAPAFSEPNIPPNTYVDRGTIIYDYSAFTDPSVPIVPPDGYSGSGEDFMWKCLKDSGSNQTRVPPWGYNTAGDPYWCAAIRPSGDFDIWLAFMQRFHGKIMEIIEDSLPSNLGEPLDHTHCLAKQKANCDDAKDPACLYMSKRHAGYGCMGMVGVPLPESEYVDVDEIPKEAPYTFVNLP